MESLKLKLDKMKCRRCNKRNEILEIPATGSKIKYAPCKSCGYDNVIRLEKWTRGPAELDLTKDSEIIQYIRDLFNLSELLEKGLNTEMLNFIHMLKRAGYIDERIHKYITLAGYNTRYSGGAKRGVELGEEYELGISKYVPRPIPNRGDWKEWQSLKPRAM